jgi:hypothetical protein
MRWVWFGHVWEIQEVHTGFWWGNIPLERWEDNIKIDLKEVGLI